ncbi:uncharacterized protein BDV17DRAFT_9087 [Aspergillus undulatus]|uniref:uncharacterized protein n=1 Tax=Aspergillus undulatus TaxID=1810928 RepID=UPI003CCCAA73
MCLPGFLFNKSTAVPASCCCARDLARHCRLMPPALSPPQQLSLLTLLLLFILECTEQYTLSNATETGTPDHHGPEIQTLLSPSQRLHLPRPIARQSLARRCLRTPNLRSRAFRQQQQSLHPALLLPYLVRCHDLQLSWICAEPRYLMPRFLISGDPPQRRISTTTSNGKEMRGHSSYNIHRRLHA